MRRPLYQHGIHLGRRSCQECSARRVPARVRALPVFRIPFFPVHPPCRIAQRYDSAIAFPGDRILSVRRTPL